MKKTMLYEVTTSKNGFNANHEMFSLVAIGMNEALKKACAKMVEDKQFKNQYIRCIELQDHEVVI